MEADEVADDEENNAEYHLAYCITAANGEKQKVHHDEDETCILLISITINLKEACNRKEQEDAINREFDALMKRETWTYVPSESATNIIPYIMNFREKMLDLEGRSFI